jgi:hypothetical protein
MLPRYSAQHGHHPLLSADKSLQLENCQSGIGIVRRERVKHLFVDVDDKLLHILVQNPLA